MTKSDVSLRIMIIDDQDSMRSIIRQLLWQVGIDDVIEARDGGTALKLLTKPRFKMPDVIICDLYMKGVDGLEFCNRLRLGKDIPNNQIPILMLTGETDDFVLDVVRQVGAAEIIHKPISAEDLFRRIQDIIGYEVAV